MITVLAGGVGAARLLTGMIRVVEPATVTVVANTGDDLVLHGLHISPDIDTLIYTISGSGNPETGWGLAGETWNAMESLALYGGEAWFRLGDRDLGTHLYRTGRLTQGASLSEVTAEIARARGLAPAILPMSDELVPTIVTLVGGTSVSFQDYFVRRAHGEPVTSLEYRGAASAAPAPGVLDAIERADAVVIAPSNPLVSIAPILSIPGIATSLSRARERTVAISPIIDGAAVKGPAAHMMSELGHEPSVVGIARFYAELASVLVVDHADRSRAGAVEEAGLRCVVTDTVMTGADEAAALSKTAIACLHG